ncbi:MAG: Hsp70 family protein [Mycobacterium sp.]|uniref:Hsp70 family protein n=1 Tax=Mycobacterium sp. TaxID=1785 RepID=UPI003C493E64
MTESLGLSIGVANLVAARVGSAAVSRKSVLTIFDNRAGEVGLPEENPNLNEPGLVMRGFVERVGDGSPLVAADGTKYLGAALTVEALEAMARTVGYGTPIAIAIPAYWSERQSAALRDEFFAQPALAPNGVPPLLISDATAALTALRTRPGFPTNGVVALCDFGAGGTSITLSNAASNFQQVGSSVRYGDFSGDEIDQLIANHLRASGSGADTDTVRMASQARLLGECRRAKEELSGASEATIATGAGADIRLSRTEFEQLISGPLDRFVSTVEEILQRNGIRANLAAVATVGGGASMPVLATRLSERLQVPIFTSPQPVVSAAVGAAVLGQQQSAAGAPTAAAPVIETPTQMASAAPPTQAVPTESAAPVPLAWSEDADGGDEPVPYTGGEHSREYAREAAGFDDPADQRYAEEAGRLPWYKRTALVLTVAGAILAVLVAVVLALTLGHTNTNPVNTTPPSAPPPTPQTVTITGPDNSTSTSVIPPPPTTNNPPPVTTTYEPTTTAAPPPPTTTAPPPTTTQPPSTSQVTTTAPPPTRERPFPLRPFEPPWRR